MTLTPEIKKNINSILIQVQQHQVNTTKGQLLILKEIGLIQNPDCTNDRLPSQCSIYNHIKPSSCTNCGHFIV